MIPIPRPSEVEPPPLPARTAVGSFVLARVHSRDEFSIRYVATASASGGEVLIEEFAPAGVSQRVASGALSPRSPAYVALWEEGLHAFVAESELLERPLHPALVRVGCVWQLRGTAFRMWPPLEGRTLVEVCASMTEPPTEEWLRGWIGPLLDALERLHDGGWVHGNVCPSQILMRPDGAPVLLDTAAARTVMGARMPQPAAWPEPAFRPPELAAPASEHLPGPWSDLYSLAAVVRFCMGAPQAADGVAPLPGAPSPGRYDSRFVAAIESALASDPQERPQTIAIFRQRLQASPVPRALATMPGAASRRGMAVSDFAAMPGLLPDPELLGSGSAPIELERTSPLPRAWLGPDDSNPIWARDVPRTPRRRRRRPWALAGVVALLASAAVATYELTREDLMPVAGSAPDKLPSVEQLLERDPTAAGPVADAAPDPRPEPAQAVASAASQPPLPPTVASAEVGAGADAGQIPPAAVRSERAVSAAAPTAPAASTAKPLPAPDTPVERRAAVADKQPAAACAPKTNFALYRCMKLLCQQSRYQTHAQCVRLQRNDELPT